MRYQLRTRDLGRSISRRRKAKGFTQAKIAEHIGVEKETVSRIETGAISPTLPRLFQLADLLECSLSELCRIDDDEAKADLDNLIEQMRGLSSEERQLVVDLTTEVVKTLKAFSRNKQEDLAVQWEEALLDGIKKDHPGENNQS